MTKENMKRNFRKTHTIADCEDCDWGTQNYKNGQAIAAIHAKSKKHKVHVEVGLGGYYDGRED